MSAPDDLHANSRIEEVELAKLHIDRSYQRDLSMRMVDEIADDWDVVASELILVSDRGERSEEEGVQGGLHVVNGQHRTAAARKLGMETIWARVIDLRNVDDPGTVEAGFRLKTNVRLGDRPLERFRAQVRAGDPESLDIVKILSRFDTEINEAPTMEGGINAVAGVEAIYRWDGTGQLLADTLALLKDAFGQVQGKTASVALLKGAAWFIIKHEDEADRSRIVERLGAVGTQALDRRARTIQGTMGQSLWVNTYRAMVDVYNERLSDRQRLEWRLRGSTAFKSSRGTGKWKTSWGG